MVKSVIWMTSWEENLLEGNVSLTVALKVSSIQKPEYIPNKKSGLYIQHPIDNELLNKSLWKL